MILFCLGDARAELGSSQDWDSLIQPSWFLLRHLFSKQINLGLDLQGGKHIVYNIDLDKAIDDKASHLKRDLDARMADDKIKETVKHAGEPARRGHGDARRRLEEGRAQVEDRDRLQRSRARGRVARLHRRPTRTRPNALCLIVSKTYADGIKATALKNAVATVGDRINASGVAEASVVTKDDDIIVELPGDPKSDSVLETEALIARTAKLEMKVVDDCSNVTTTGCTQSGMHNGSKYMQALFKHVGSDRKGNASDPEALKLAITVDVDQWRPEDGGGLHTDYFLLGVQPRNRDAVRVGEEARQAQEGRDRRGRQGEGRADRPRDHRALHVRRQGAGLPGPDRLRQGVRAVRRSSARVRRRGAGTRSQGDAQVLAHVLPRARGPAHRLRYRERGRDLRSEHAEPDRPARLQSRGRPRVRRCHVADQSG